MNQAKLRRSGPSDDNLARLRRWYMTPLGQTLEAAEVAAVRDALGTLFGFHLLLAAPPWQTSPLDASRVSQRLIMSPARHDSSALLGTPAALPIVGDSLDAIVLPHTLEFVEQPHEVLREVERCLIPEGHVLILGFNPYGLWGLWRLLHGRRRRLPWPGRFISQTRVRDWLALLGFDTLSCRPVLFRPPLQGLASSQRLQLLDRLAERGWPIPAAGYQLLARKRVVGMTPIRPRWRPRRSLLAGGLIEPTRHSHSRGYS